jgi:hypothetical protein
LEKDTGWDRENTLPNFRQILKRILKKKMNEYVEYLKGFLPPGSPDTTEIDE